jgi:hypothetical protein
MGFKAASEFETTIPKRWRTSIDAEIHQPTEKNVDMKNNYTNQYMIKLSNEIGGYSCGFITYYDTLYDNDTL